MDNNEQINKINWFPGHMKKATDEIIKKIKDVDFIIEVLDARAIESTSNNELIEIVNHKPIIKIALKSDLSDISHSIVNGVLIGNVKDNKFKKQILSYLKTTLKEKIDKLQKKGLVKYELIGMIVGIPNIGKSSLINFLSSKNDLVVQNRAGVTKKQTIKKINENFYLIDTPGVLFKKIRSIEEGYKLSILNNIEQKVLPLYDVIKFQYNFMINNYELAMNDYFKLSSKMEYDDFLNFIAFKYKFFISSNEIDIDRTLQFLFNLFSKSIICKFHFNDI